MLEAIFYARFHPLRGPSIIHQYPPTSILPPPSSSTPPLIDWPSISAYIIPPYDLCNQSFSILSGSHRVLGYPISLEDPEYDRNRFTFNICFVIHEGEKTGSWEGIVRKTGKFFESIEKDDCVLQIEEDLKGLKLAGEEGYPEREVGTVAYLLERVWEDLNAFGECCVQLPGWGTSTLNLRFEEPEDGEAQRAVKVRTWDVPVLIRELPKREEWTWDLTLERVGQWIDGVRCVGRIAEVADVEAKLVKRCVRELVLLRRAVVVDCFHFGAIYTCTKEAVLFVRDDEAQRECREYVAAPRKEGEEKVALPTKETLIMLYTALQPGTPLRDFCLEHADALQNLDIRRFITFGILKGFLRRIHKYALALENTVTAPLPGEKKRSGSSRPSGDEAIRAMDRAYKKAALSSGWATPPMSLTQNGSGSLGHLRRSEDEVMHDRLMFYLDGEWPLDRACVEMGISEKGFMEKVRAARCGEVVPFNK